MSKSPARRVKAEAARIVMPAVVMCGMEAMAVIDETGVLTESGVVGPVPWWSFTKTVLAIAALRLVDSGALNLKQEVGDERYTLRQLLRHEAGLPDYGSLSSYHADVTAGEAPWPIERLLTAVDVGRLRYDPGAGWGYSNIGYLKVAQLVERTTGMALNAGLEHLVFGPSSLTTARLATVPADVADVHMGSARQYHPGWVYHGLVVGTVADAARLLRALMTDGLLKPTTLAEMLEGRSLPQHRSANHPDAAYGLGLMLSANNPINHPVGHTGEGPGSRIAVYAQGRKVASVWKALPSSSDAETYTLGFLS